METILRKIHVYWLSFTMFFVNRNPETGYVQWTWRPWVNFAGRFVCCALLFLVAAFIVARYQIRDLTPFFTSTTQTETVLTEASPLIAGYVVNGESQDPPVTNILVVVKSGELKLLKGEKVMLDFHDGNGRYGISASLGRLGAKCVVWDPDHDIKPIILSDNVPLDLDHGEGTKTTHICVMAADDSEVLMYQLTKWYHRRLVVAQK
ncbi:MAG TPA: hypothetical protein VL335_01110 [Candidatus Paceibacterota bacterium]|jgi:hypothetical protein|nr:hypothetical protein [Candidatus Paceibacterota bacterium]